MERDDVMIHTGELTIVQYCHPHCTPFRNICRLPEPDAFALAYAMAAEHPDTTAFYRFADFANYYPRRMKTDRYLHESFVSLGGKPTETHPLSFVLQGSEYLREWFGGGNIHRIPLRGIPSESISFTLGDSMAMINKDRDITVYTKEMLLEQINAYPGALAEWLKEMEERYYYIEVQLWNDAYCTDSFIER